MPDDAVSPILGTVLLLGIFAVTSTAVLLASGPILDRLSSDAAYQQVTGDLAQAHDVATGLGGPDAQRLLTVRNPSGQLSVGGAGRMAVTINQDTMDVDNDLTQEALACDFILTGWEDPAAAVLAFSTAGCRPLDAGGCGNADACVDAFRVVGGALQPVASTSTATTLNLGQPVGADEWLFRLRTAGPGDVAVLAETWLLRGDRLVWDAPGSTWAAWGFGTVLGSTGGALAAIREFPMDPPHLRLASLHANPGGGTNEVGPQGILVRLASSLLRADLDGRTLTTGPVDHPAEATRVRWQFHGGDAVEQCRMLDFKDRTVATGLYTSVAGCTGPVTGIVFDSVEGSATDTFPLEVIHATYQVRFV